MPPENPQLPLHCCCAGGTALRSPVENGATPRGRSTTTNARDMIGQNNHDCGFCPGTVMGNFTTCTMDPNWQVGHARTTSDEFPEENRTQRVPQFHLSFDRKSTTTWDGSPHSTRHLWATRDVTCWHCVKKHETQIHCKSQADVDCCHTGDHSMRRSTFGSNCCGGPTRQQHNNDMFCRGLGLHAAWTSCLRHGTATPSSPIESKHNTQLTSGVNQPHIDEITTSSKAEH